MVARANRGVTVVELSVVMVLVSTLLTLLAIYLVRGQRLAIQTDAYAQAHRQANIALRRVCDEAFKASYHHLECGDNWVYMLSYRPTTDSEPFIEFELLNGKILWKKWVCFFLDEDNLSLKRAEIKLTQPESELIAKPEPQVDISSFLGLSPQEKTPIASQIKSFKASKDSSNPDAPTLSIFVTSMIKSGLATAKESDKNIEIKVQTTVSLIN